MGTRPKGDSRRFVRVSAGFDVRISAGRTDIGEHAVFARDISSGGLGLIIDEDPELLARCITAVHQVQLWDWIEKGMTEPVQQVADRLDKLFLEMFCINMGQGKK